MTPLQSLLNSFRTASASEREKGTYFEELIVRYLRNEPSYKDLYSDVWTYGQWADLQKLDKRDTGIDLVAQASGTGEFHAIQCKLYDESYRLQKSDIDSFFTASGKKPFTHRIIVSTTNLWSEHADEALRDQQPPVTKIDLTALEESQIDWSAYQPKASPVLRQKKELLKHQELAVQKVVDGLADADRGKLIMACGTGKTFTSLRIAEAVAGKGKKVLFLVPSLALLSQALTEWSHEAQSAIHSFAVCSDADVGKKRKRDDDTVQTFTHELRYPATTNASRLAMEVAKRHEAEHMTVVFGTYHSIGVLGEAQAKFGLDEFDLVICDEAHRTTGATFGDEDESSFVKVHDNSFLKARKRLYMTATPRIYGESAKATAEKDNVALCSMDDKALYGEELHVITFSEAVKRGLLVDYKVIVLAVEESHVNRRLQRLLADGDNQLKVDDAAKIIGCWKALAKQGLEGPDANSEPMRRAVAFCQVIELSKGAKTHKVSSKQIAGMFQAVVEAYQEQEEDEAASTLACQAEHVDGSMNASEKESKLAWLKQEPPEDTCRVLSNVRCLSEGVDVPALDAVLFLTPRNSQVDVVQSVGRVMRNAPGKKLGYVILPVVIPAGVEPHEALNDNKTYAVVWQVLQALRSHDDRFDAMVNKLDLIGKDTSKMEVIAITEKVQRKQKATAGARNKEAGRSGFTIGKTPSKPAKDNSQADLQFEIGEIEKAIYAKLVQKVGNRHHWEDWANDIAKIARTHIDRISAILDDEKSADERTAFAAFAKELRNDLNGSISDEEIVEMLAQHLITKPVFDALFSDYSFAKHNPMSKAMQAVLDALQEHRLDKEADTLDRFYDSVRMRADGINSAAAKQKIVVELYDRFFKNAFPKMTERLGIVYTPVEVVDFIIKSVAQILEHDFNQTLSSRGVHIIDPFTGTGTFITRLLQSGLISREHLPHKYKHEIHANELVLLAYYIAAINIEAVYHSIVGGNYQPFEGICLTDTFQMYEREDLVEALAANNGGRRKRQKRLDIRVILGNPPYSVGQENANDDNQNVAYPALDERIRSTYAERSSITMVRALYDSYIRAIRWASDRIGSSGVIGFVTNGSYLDANSADGLRKCLVDEFSSIHILNLRGNQRTAGELSRREGGKIFGGGSRAPIAIAILVKNPLARAHGQIRYHDIGEYLTREEKLRRIAEFGSIAGVPSWTTIAPDDHGDWLKQRDGAFERFLPLGEKRGSGATIFEVYSRGLSTQRDAWSFNSSRTRLESNMKSMINFYNEEVQRFIAADLGRLASNEKERVASGFVSKNLKRIKWAPNLLLDLVAGKSHTYQPSSLIQSHYRPFCKMWVYYEKSFVWSRYQLPQIFPTPASRNRVIAISGTGGRTTFSALMLDGLPSLHVADIDSSQCFPLYLYSQKEASQFEIDIESTYPSERRSAITDTALAGFRASYADATIEKDDIFYFVYGLLHSAEYRLRYADSLGKNLPRLPFLRGAASFWTFAQAGRSLADLHVNFDQAPPYPVKIECVDPPVGPEDYRVEKMRYGKKGRDKDLTTLHYNDKITMTGIPVEAYEYVVNGKPALDWVVERQCVKVDKDSGIVNDANDWAIETMNNPRYPLELFQRVITVSLETMKIVKSLPPLDIIDEVPGEALGAIKVQTGSRSSKDMSGLEASLDDPMKTALHSVVNAIRNQPKQ